MNKLERLLDQVEIPVLNWVSDTNYATFVVAALTSFTSFLFVKSIYIALVTGSIVVMCLVTMYYLNLIRQDAATAEGEVSAYIHNLTAFLKNINAEDWDQA